MAVGTTFTILSVLVDIVTVGLEGTPMPLLRRLVLGKVMSKIPVARLLRKYTGLRTPLGAARAYFMKY